MKYSQVSHEGHYKKDVVLLNQITERYESMKSLYQHGSWYTYSGEGYIAQLEINYLKMLTLIEKMVEVTSFYWKEVCFSFDLTGEKCKLEIRMYQPNNTFSVMYNWLEITMQTTKEEVKKFYRPIVLLKGKMSEAQKNYIRTCKFVSEFGGVKKLIKLVRNVKDENLNKIFKGQIYSTTNAGVWKSGKFEGDGVMLELEKLKCAYWSAGQSTDRMWVKILD